MTIEGSRARDSKSSSEGDGLAHLAIDTLFKMLNDKAVSVGQLVICSWLVNDLKVAGRGSGLSSAAYKPLLLLLYICQGKRSPSRGGCLGPRLMISLLSPATWRWVGVLCDQQNKQHHSVALPCVHGTQYSILSFLTLLGVQRDLP